MRKGEPIQAPSFPDREFCIVDFGAEGNGKTICTQAIRDAIGACSQSGGGKVVIPPGYWVTGPIILKSNVNLHAMQGAFISFTPHYSQYPLIPSHFEGLPTIRCMPQIYAEGETKIAVTGKGVFDGSGEAWRMVKDWKMTARQWSALTSSGGVIKGDGENQTWWPSEEAYQGSAYNSKMGGMVTDLEEAGRYRHFFRPVLVGLVKCRQVLLEGVTFQNSPAWCVHPRMCEQLLIRDVAVRNPWYAQNGDALDIESCRHVEVSGCSFDAGDDGICLKAGKNKPGRDTEQSAEDIWIHGCVVYHGHGGFVIGSEMSCGVRQVLVENCTFTGTDTGLRFKSCPGRGGIVEDIIIRDIRMKDIGGDAIVFSMGYGSALGSGAGEMECPREDLPEFRSVTMERILCRGAARAVSIDGLDTVPVHDIVIRDSELTAGKGVQCRRHAGITLDNVTVRRQDGKKIYFERETLPDGEYATSDF